MKIALVGSWNLADGYLGAANALRRLGNDVDFVPAQQYFSEHRKDHVLRVMQDIQRIDADVVLWWRAETLDDAQLGIVRNQVRGKFIMFSWDDPFQWESHGEMPLKCRYLDVVYTCCASSVDDYLRHGAKKAIYCPPGFDRTIHYPEYDPEYECDVSLVCTNLYHGDALTKHDHISRQDMIQWLVDLAPELDVRLYGPEHLGEIFPNQYKGWIPFNESRKVFTSSKLNLCTHIRPDGDMYINERVTQIMGSCGLLFVDRVKGLEKLLDLQRECIVMETESPEKFVNQTKNILSKISSFDSVKRSGYAKAMRLFSWDSWAKTVVENL